MKWIKDGVAIITSSLILFLLTDFVITWAYGARGFSKFFVSNTIEGRQNKPGFSGGFGAILDEFNGQVSIGLMGERVSYPAECEDIERRALFLGDSTTAGFEVDDNKTFVSLANNSCSNTKTAGINFGVRAHDTHAVIGTYRRVASKIHHDYVVYLMSYNDWSENVDANAYKMMSRRFGRLYENVLVPPDDSLIFSIYADLRVFVGDRLSLTTFILKNMPKLFRSNDSVTKDIKQKIQLINTEVMKTFELIEQLWSLSEVHGAKLIVIPYPNLGFENATRKKKISLLGQLLNDNLDRILFIEDIDARVASKLKADGRQPFEMKFRGDGHLSEYGHNVMSTLIVNVFQDLQSINY